MENPECTHIVHFFCIHSSLLLRDSPFYQTLEKKIMLHFFFFFLLWHYIVWNNELSIEAHIMGITYRLNKDSVIFFQF